MSKLAINGGSKIRKDLFPSYDVLGEEEAMAAYNVVKSGVLSKYLGCWHKDFFGGPEVQAFEEEWSIMFNAKHSISVNSNTSGIICALGALNIGPGDEVIVSGYSMSISASAPLFYGAIPVFADIEENYFCLDPKSVESKITHRTKAVIVVDIFGQPYDYEGFQKLKNKYGIKIIEDTAQAPYSTLNGSYCGTLGDIGIYSLNYHKHIHTGEGGMIVTNDSEIATRLQLIRNHAEAVVDGMNYQGDRTNMIGFNMRLPEIEAAIGRSLLKKLPHLIRERVDNVRYLESKIKDIPFLTMPKIRHGAEHSYYVHSIRYDKTHAESVHRNDYINALKAELSPCLKREDDGVLIGAGYVKPLYLQSLYQSKIGFGKLNYPFNDPNNLSITSYDKGICPVTERMHFEEVITHELMRPGLSKFDLDDISNAFLKVADNLNELS